MYLLNEIITNKTKILELEPYTEDDRPFLMAGKSLEDLTKMEKVYITMMCKGKNGLYYAKRQSSLNLIRYSVVNELLGTKLCEKMNVPSIRYEITHVDDELGIASKNFRCDSSKDYCYTSEIIGDALIYSDSLIYLELLKNMCISKKNEEEMLDSFFKLMAVDIYMAQGDRNNHNLQWSIDKESKYFRMEKAYDFGDCAPSIDYFIKKSNNGRILLNPVIVLYKNNIKRVLDRYKMLREYLEEIIKIDLTECIEEIFDDYDFYKGEDFEDIIYDYYEKEKVQKMLIKERILS